MRVMSARWPPRRSPSRSRASASPRRASARSTRTRACSCTAATTSPSSRSTRRYEEVAFLLLEGELPSRRRARRRSRSSWRRARAASRRSPTIVDGNAMDASPMETLRTAVSALSFSDPAEDAIDRESERAQGRRADRAAADDRRALPAAPARPSRPSIRTLARLRRELPHDAARRGADGGGGAGLRDRDDPARRARDERLDVHGAGRRRHERRPALGRSSRPSAALEGAAPRRRQPGGDGDVRRVRLAPTASPTAFARGWRRSSRSTASAIRSIAPWIRALRSCGGSRSSSPTTASRTSSRSPMAAEREAHEQKGLWPNVDLYSGVLYH